MYSENDTTGLQPKLFEGDVPVSPVAVEKEFGYFDWIVVGADVVQYQVEKSTVNSFHLTAIVFHEQSTSIGPRVAIFRC